MTTALVVRAPPHCACEFAWVCSVLFERWLGLPCRIEHHEHPWIEVQAGAGRVRWADAFFGSATGAWLQPASLPAAPLPAAPLPDQALRDRIGRDDVLQPFGDGRFECRPDEVHLPVDITGSSFFMLSRYEEAVEGAPADVHGRFPGRSSTAHRAGAALRPLVDEWVELLWWALQRVAPGLQRRVRTPGIWVSCDVDAPYSPGSRSALLAARQIASHLLNDRSPALAARAALHAVASRVGIDRFDPFDTFDWMLDANERAGQRMSFFFLGVARPQRIDGCYELGEERIARLLHKLVSRGHELGLHGSYRSIEQRQRLADELAALRQAAARAGSTQPHFGGRQHYLRWRAAESPALLQDAGLAYDSTLGFPDIAGFRCGTSHAYPLFDLAARRALPLVERPLVLMEVTVTSSTYMNLGHGEAAHDLMMGLRRSCQRFGGEFSLLWHNSNFGHPGARELYEALIQPL